MKCHTCDGELAASCNHGICPLCGGPTSERMAKVIEALDALKDIDCDLDTAPLVKEASNLYRQEDSENVRMLKDIMTRHGLSGYRVDKLLDVSVSTCSRWLTGRQNVGRVAAAAIRYMGMHLDREKEDAEKTEN